MTMVREGARQTMAWLHGWTGLLLGHILYVISLAGTLSVFKPEIGRWMRPETTASADPNAALLAAAAWLGRNAPDATGWYLGAPDDRANTVEAYWDKGPVFLFRALDPVTGAPVPRETLGGEFFYRLHFELQLPYPWGRLLASLAAMAMLVALVTGIIAHRRFFRDFFTFRPRRGQRSWLDGHNVLGVLSLPFHLMITFTGIVTLASLSLPWAARALYGNDNTALYRDITPGMIERAVSGHHTSLAPLGSMLQDATRICGSAPGRISVSNPGDAAAVVTAFCSDTTQITSSPGEISYDGATGRRLTTWLEQRPGITTYYTLYGLHMVRFAPTLLRWLYFLGGAMLTLAIATGLHLWVIKRRSKSASTANKAIDRANASVLIGVPIGMAAFLWANRLLPLGLVGRAEWEVSIALWVAAASVVAGLVLPARHSWALLFVTLGVGLILVPWIGSGPAWFAAAWMRADATLITGSLLFTTVGIAAGATGLIGLRRTRRPGRGA